MVKEYRIRDIEAITEAEAEAMALERMEIKEHNIYMVDFGGYFKYSCLVFKNGHHIYYANDYELHHSGKTRDELRAFYIDKLNNILFTEAEIGAPLKDYGEFDRKKYYLLNYYGMQNDRLSIFGNFSDANNVKAFERKKLEYPYYCEAGLAYYKDADFVGHYSELLNKLMAARDAMKDNFEYWKGAFKSEMANHEYHINWQADYDTLSAFGGIIWRGEREDEVECYFNDLGFNDIQRRAYITARKEYYKELKEWA